ncbi:MAG: hypothetical protein QOD07_2401 [Frankiaceae bacterium]|jgi:hypothetical protein|nr:hypothetical protein [Frankiaceae bacterium]
MRTVQVDPRDTVWEWPNPTYRVYFWDGSTSDEWQVDGADVPEVLAWAEARARETRQTYWLNVLHNDRAEGLGLIRLAGWEGPQDPEFNRPPHAVDRP